MRKIVLIDDEIDSILLLRDCLTDIPDYIISGEARSVKEGITLIEAVQPDIVFLDIELNEGSGFDILNHFKEHRFNIIFVTAFNQFALKAFKANAIDYLLKPVSKGDVLNSLNKIRDLQIRDFNNLSLLKSNLNTNKIDRLVVNNTEGTHYLGLTEISCISSEGGNYTYINLPEKKLKVLISKNLGEFEYLTECSTFFRIHQCHIVNLDYVRQLVRSEEGDQVMLKDGTQLPLSRRRKEDFKEAMKSF